MWKKWVGSRFDKNTILKFDIYLYDLNNLLVSAKIPIGCFLFLNTVVFQKKNIQFMPVSGTT